MRYLKDDNIMEFKGLQAGMKIANVTWSPDETKIAFTNTVANGTELWIADG